MSETTFSPFGFGKGFYRTPLYGFVAGYHHLCNTVTIGYHERFGRKVYQDDTDFATIVGIYRTWRIEYADAFFQGQSRAGTHLGLISGWQGYAQTGRDKCAA